MAIQQSDGAVARWAERGSAEAAALAALGQRLAQACSPTPDVRLRVCVARGCVAVAVWLWLWLGGWVAVAGCARGTLSRNS